MKETSFTYKQQLEEATIDYWLAALREIREIPAGVDEITNSLSWKLTHPLRVVRSRQIKVKSNLVRLLARD